MLGIRRWSACSLDVLAVTVTRPLSREGVSMAALARHWATRADWRVIQVDVDQPAGRSS